MDSLYGHDVRFQIRSVSYEHCQAVCHLKNRGTISSVLWLGLGTHNTPQKVASGI